MNEPIFHFLNMSHLLCFVIQYDNIQMITTHALLSTYKQNGYFSVLHDTPMISCFYSVVESSRQFETLIYHSVIYADSIFPHEILKSTKNVLLSMPSMQTPGMQTTGCCSMTIHHLAIKGHQYKYIG